MPFGPMTRPAIGISLLKAQLAARAIPCDIRYLNLYFAELVGQDTYHELSEDVPTSSLFGDWLFREDLFGSDSERDHEYLTKYLPGQYRGAFEADQLELYVSCKQLVSPFLEVCLQEIPWERYDMVGFTSTFQQTVPSLAFARRIKERYPRIKIAMGGANCEGAMGRELHRLFPFLDFVFSGESDKTFPILAEAILRDPDGPSPTLPGLTGRGGSPLRVVSTPPQPLPSLDDLPFPDYADFIEALSVHGFSGRFNIQFLIETSRGCWWGEKQHCTFCGLNGQSMKYRSKSPERVLAELSHLVERYDARVIWGTDNILDVRYFRTVLPKIKELGLKLSLFFETKANLRKDQLSLMKEVGLDWFQPGIESLNTHQLALMKKGCTALQNIQLLKWVRQYRMLVTWNMLMGFPGETPDDYEQAARYCDALAHLQPPSGAHPIRLDRFSPYFNNPDAYGLADLQPYPSYGYVYPFPLESLQEIAYFFVFKYRDGYDPIVAGMPMLKSVARWSHRDSFSVLYAIPGDQFLLIIDSRPNSEESRLMLSGVESRLYLFCDAIHSFKSIYKHATDAHPAVTEQEVRAFLNRMVQKRLMLEEDDDYLSLAVLVESDSDLGPIPDQRKGDVRESVMSQISPVHL